MLNMQRDKEKIYQEIKMKTEKSPLSSITNLAAHFDFTPRVALIDGMGHCDT